MNSKLKQKLGILVVLGLLLVAIGVPVMAATTDNTTVNQAVDTVKGRFGLGNGAGTCTGMTDAQRAQMQANRDARLNAKVESGQLTQADYDARVALQAKMEQYRDTLTDLSASERQAKLKEYRTQSLQELLNAGTITQAQFDQMSAAPGPGGRGGRGNGGNGTGMGLHRMGGNGAGGSGCGMNCNK